MPKYRPWLTIETQEQPNVQVDDLLIVPQSQIVTLRTPLGIWRWVRPEALLVQSDEGLSRLPIHDPTRWFWLAAWFAAIMALMLSRSRVRDHKRRA